MLNNGAHAPEATSLACDGAVKTRSCEASWHEGGARTVIQYSGVCARNRIGQELRAGMLSDLRQGERRIVAVCSYVVKAATRHGTAPHVDGMLLWQPMRSKKI